MAINQTEVLELAATLGHLPHPDGSTLQFIQYETFGGQPEEQQQQVRQVSEAIAAAILNFWDQRGKTLIDKNVVAEPSTIGQSIVVALRCPACGQQLLRVTASNDGTATIPAAVLAAVNPDCPHA